MAEALSFARQLAAWAKTDLRVLPWRRTRDPWAVLVSEVMLQQTQVARVVGPYENFMRRFPTVSACAAATAAEVITAWAGLGYNRRAVMLHACAQVCARDHGGQVPGHLDALMTLPGIGPYTARAVLAFAYEHRVAPVDVNVARVLARAVAARPLSQSEAQPLADGMVPARGSWRWSQGLMELGAVYCRRTSPRCESCPVLGVCAWRSTGDAGDPAAGVGSTQSRFAGSDRQGRGRLIAALRADDVAQMDVATTMGWPDDPERAARVAKTLIDDGLVVDAGGVYALRR